MGGIVRPEDEVELAVPGTTVVLTDRGWEAAEYVDPDDNWMPQPDGSYVSPDGSLRSWPLAGPAEG
jgi:hypothetical protein